MADCLKTLDDEFIIDKRQVLSDEASFGNQEWNQVFAMMEQVSLTHIGLSESGTEHT